MVGGQGIIHSGGGKNDACEAMPLTFWYLHALRLLVVASGAQKRLQVVSPLFITLVWNFQHLCYQ